MGDDHAELRPAPLYKQVRQELVRRIAEGIWQPGQGLPSEFEIAAELGVSQGTVRKALDEMTAERLVVRRQGSGTYVARHDDARVLFQFFKLVPDSGVRRFPDGRIYSLERVPAGPDEAERLDLDPGAEVVAIERVRAVGGVPSIVERIVVASALYPGLADRDLPNNLYELYAGVFGVTIAGATERLKAVAAGPREAERLGVPLGAPLLAIDRVARAIDGTIAEWRVSLCRTEDLHYVSELP